MGLSCVLKVQCRFDCQHCPPEVLDDITSVFPLNQHINMIAAQYASVHNKHTTKGLVREEDVKNSPPGIHDIPPQMGDHLELHTRGRGWN